MRVAFVDDSETLLDAYKDYYSEFFIVETYLSTTLALQEIPKRRFDIVIIDWHMPEMLGGTFLAKLKNIIRGGNYVFHSSSNDPKVIEKMLSHSPDDIISKNENPLIVMEKIRHRVKTIRNSRVPYWCGIHFNDNLRSIDINGEVVKFTDVEYRLLRFIVYKDSEIVSKKDIATNIWGQEISSDSIEFQFSSIRKKLYRYSDLIQTKKGEGYFLNIHFWDTFDHESNTLAG